MLIISCCGILAFTCFLLSTSWCSKLATLELTIYLLDRKDIYGDFWGDSNPQTTWGVISFVWLWSVTSFVARWSSHLPENLLKIVSSNPGFNGYSWMKSVLVFKCIEYSFYTLRIFLGFAVHWLWNGVSFITRLLGVSILKKSPIFNCSATYNING